MPATAVLNITAQEMRARAALANTASIDKTMAELRECVMKAAEHGRTECLVTVDQSLVPEVTGACARQGFSVSSGRSAFDSSKYTVDLIIIW